MPNHVVNRLIIDGDKKDIDDVMLYIKNDELGIGSIDFNKLTKMPDWIYGSNPSVEGIRHEDRVLWGLNNTSLEWAKNNWGTKWNAYGQIDKRNISNTFYFQTAWNGVRELIQKIAWIFPDVTVRYDYASEELGSDICGRYEFKGSDILKQDTYLAQCDSAYALADELWSDYNEDDD